MNKLALAIIGLLIATAAWGQIVGSGTNTGSYFDPRDTLGMGVVNNFTTSGGGGCTAAPDGNFDLSACSNAYYVAVIL